MSQIRDHRTRALSYGGHEFVTVVRKGLKSGFFSFLVKVANSAIISQVCVKLKICIIIH